MLKNVFVLLLSSIFILIMVMPTVIIFLDDSIDMSMFYNISEEEKDSKQEKNKDSDFILLEIKNALQGNNIECKKELLELSLVYYTKPHIKQAFPPPKMIFSINS